MMNDRDKFVLRCEVSGNPCGTDTHQIGYPCQCNQCKAAQAIRELETDNKQVEESNEALHNRVRTQQAKITKLEACNAELEGWEKACKNESNSRAKLQKLTVDCGERLSEAEDKITELEAELAERDKDIIISYACGYEGGHDATVESYFGGDGRIESHFDTAIEWLEDANREEIFEYYRTVLPPTEDKK